jgi:hypothetical protein
MILEIEGKRVEVDESFRALSPEEQDRTVREIAGQMGLGGEAEPEAESGGGGSQLAAGLVDVFGAPGDMLASGLRGIGLGGALDAMGVSEQPGTSTVTRGLEAVGVDPAEEDPDDLFGKAQRGAGQAAGALLPFGAAAKGLQVGGQAARFVGNKLMQPFVSTPGRAMAAETAAGAGFGLGEGIAEQHDASPLGQFAGGLIGSVTAAMGPGAVVRAGQTASRFIPGVAMAIRGVRAAIFPFTEAGGKVRASKRVRGLSADPEADAARLDEPSVGNLTPAQQTGSDRLMALERAVLDKDARLDAEFKQRTADSSAALREAVREPAQGMGAEQAQQFIGERVNYLASLLDQRVLQAEEAAKARLAKLEPQQRASQAAAIARAELEAALRATRNQERQLWNAIPGDVMVPTDNARATYERIIQSLPKAQADDMAEKARQFLGEITGNQAFKDQEPFKEAHGLYSALRQEAREARAAKQFNRARIADEIADSILEDIGSRADDASDIGRLFRDARDFSRALNERFNRGSIGRILGRERDGGEAVAPELTLDRTIGQQGLKAAVSADDMRNAIGDSPDAESAMRDYLRRRFQDYVVRDGKIEPSRAQAFVRQNDELLDRFPDLKREMQAGEAAQIGAERTTRTAGERAKRLRDPKRSRTAEFLKADPEKAIETAIKNRSPREAARNLRQLTRKDQSGEALAGLKGAFLDYLIRQSRTGQIDEAGEAILSGRRAQRLLNEPRVRAVATELLTTDEFKRAQRIVQEFRHLETSQGRLPDVGEPMQDLPNTILSYVGRVMAARAGARAGAGSSGASLLTAHFASKRMKEFLERFTNDHAEALIRDAIQDKELFQTLLRGVDSPRNARNVERRMIEWLEGYTAAQAGEVSDDQRSPERQSTPRY